MSNSEPMIQAIFDTLAHARALNDEAAAMLKEAQPLLVGRRIRYGGFVHQIVRAYVAYGNNVGLTGVRVGKNGNVGSRQFYCGLLKRAEFVDGDQADV